MKQINTLRDAFDAGDDLSALSSMESIYRSAACGLVEMFESGRMTVEKLDDALRCVGYRITAIDDTKESIN